MLYLVMEHACGGIYDECNKMVIGVFETKELAEKCIAAIIEEAEKDFNAEANRRRRNDRFEKSEYGYTEINRYETLWCYYDITEIELNKRI